MKIGAEGKLDWYKTAWIFVFYFLLFSSEVLTARCKYVDQGLVPAIDYIEEEDSSGMKSNTKPVLLHEFVVSGSRWKAEKTKSSHSIRILDSTLVNRLNPQTSADLLSLSGKVFIQKSQMGGGSPMIRGFATNRLIYTVDGIRMNTAIFRAGNIQNVINIDPFSLAGTEVLLGANSVMYGSDAIGGVMSFRTRTAGLHNGPGLRVSGEVTARHSTANQEKTGHASLQLATKKWASYTSVSHWDFDHLRQGSHGPDDYIKDVFVQPNPNGRDSIIRQKDPLLQIPTAYSQLNILQKFRYQATDRLNMELAYHYSNTSSYGRYDRHNRFRQGRPRYAVWDYGPQGWTMLNFSLTHQGHGIYDEMSVKAAYQNFRESRIDRNFGAITQTTQTEKVDAYSLNVDFRKKISDTEEIRYGLESVLNKVESSGGSLQLLTNETKLGPSRYPQADWLSTAAYLAYQLKISDQWQIDMGARYNFLGIGVDFSNNQAFFPIAINRFQVNHGQAVSHLSGIYRPNASTVISSNLSTAFRAPNVDDMGKFFESEPDRITVPNSSLRSEYAYSADLNLLHQLFDWLRVEASMYYTYLDRALVRRDFQIDGMDSISVNGERFRVQAIQNAAFAQVYGYSVGFELKPTTDLKIQFDLNHQFGTEETDDGGQSPARHVAPLFGRWQASYQLSAKLQLLMHGQFQGGRKAEDLAIEERSKTEIYAKDELGRNYVPSYHIFHASAELNVHRHLVIRLSAENLTDRRYRPYSSGVSGAGRQLVASVTFRF